MAGVLIGGARADQITNAIAAVTLAPAAVKPYAQKTRAHGHVNGLRQSRPNDSFNNRRKSSVIGFGSAAFHNSHMNHAAAPKSIIPHSAMNAMCNMPPRYTRRSHGTGTG